MAAKPDLPKLHLQIARMRYFEVAIADLWRQGLISGELHLGTGEEAIVAGVVAHLIDGDALALDHRSTPPLVARGVDLKAMLLELLGHEQGLCGGQGGHMHLFAPERLAASSGIVAASAPMACGFALSAQHLRPGRVAVAFFGEGAMNQGMLMESLNLAVAWRLPAVFVCKDNALAATTVSQSVTGGDLLERARSFGLPARRVDGTRVERVWNAAGWAVDRARTGRGPSFLLARCQHLDGHFLGDPLLRVLDQPLAQSRELAPPLVAAFRQARATPLRARVSSLLRLAAPLARLALARYVRPRDPLRAARRRLPAGLATQLESAARREVEAAVAQALQVVGRSAHV